MFSPDLTCAMIVTNKPKQTIAGSKSLVFNNHAIDTKRATKFRGKVNFLIELFTFSIEF